MTSLADNTMSNLISAGYVTGSMSDRLLQYLTSKTAVGKSISDKATALGLTLNSGILGPVKNLCPNPALNVDSLGYGGSSAGLLTGFGFARVANGGPVGNKPYCRFTIATAGTPPINSDILLVGRPSWADQALGAISTVKANRLYTLSAYVRSNIAQKVNIQAQGITGGAGAGTWNGVDVTLVPNTWTRLSVTFTPTSATLAIRGDINIASAAPIAWAINDTIDSSCWLLHEGSVLQPYSDGGDTNWSWLGAVGSSPSNGPFSFI